MFSVVCKEYAFWDKIDSSIRKWSITKQIKLSLVMCLMKKKRKKEKRKKRKLLPPELQIRPVETPLMTKT